MTEDFLGLFRNDPGVVFLKPAQELFKKGEPGSHMYVVKSGEVHVLETVSPGGIVGEMSLINDEPRTATVRAITEAEVVSIDQKRFLFLVQQTPFFAIRVMRVMSARLKAMNDRVLSLPE